MQNVDNILEARSIIETVDLRSSKCSNHPFLSVETSFQSLPVEN